MLTKKDEEWHERTNGREIKRLFNLSLHHFGSHSLLVNWFVDQHVWNALSDRIRPLTVWTNQFALNNMNLQ